MENTTLLNEKQAAEYLTVSERCLQAWRFNGNTNLVYLKIGRLVRYRKSDLDTWIEGQIRSSTSDKGGSK